MTEPPSSPAANASPPPIDVRRQQARFFLVFLPLAAVLVPGVHLLERFDWFAAVVRGLCTAHAWVAHGVLRGLGFEVLRWGTRISGEGFTVVVTSACSGLLGSVLLVSAVLAFPAGWKARAGGMLLGVAALSLLNQVRILSLFYIGSRFPGAFDEAHFYIWPLLIIVGVAVYFYFWVQLIVAPRQGPA